MRSVCVSFCLLLCICTAFAQSDRGTVTGTISDPAGAMVPGATVEAKNTATGSQYQTASTTTGNYTLAQLPAGVYQLSVSVPGFKQYVRQGINVLVAQTLRIDVSLEVGALTESVTVSADAPLLKTESSEMADNVKTDRLNSLPILGIGPAGSGMRNFYAVTQLVPGASWTANSTVRLNGTPANTQALRIEGQDSTNGLWAQTPSQTSPSVDAIQEFAIQTNNFAAEYGQAGGAVFNLTMKSGSNQFHGSAYEYWVNEALNANQPFLNVRPVQRRSDFGFTLGGPVWIPRAYDGHDKTFFFFNFEQYRDNQIVNNIPLTVPVQAYRNGDFTQALTGKIVGTDPLGRPIPEGGIYDPGTARLVDGKMVADLFPNNTIPQNRFDPVSVKVQSLIPQPNLPGLINNYLPTFSSPTVRTVPAVKIDHTLNNKMKLSGYWSRSYSWSPALVGYGQADGLPDPITAARGSFLLANTYRLSFDDTVTPRLLLHAGIGLVRFRMTDDSPVMNFDAEKQLGLKGTYGQGRFPNFTAMNSTTGKGGMVNMGPLGQYQIREERPTANISLTWVRNNHTYKAGTEMILDGYPSQLLQNTNGIFNFSAGETSQPYLAPATSIGGLTPGFPYASFLLGAVDAGNIGVPMGSRLGNQSWALFVQDSWKVTRKFTLDYGIRWDYQTYLTEQYGRMPTFSLTTPNPSAGNLPGALIFEGSQPGHCNCTFASNYPYAIGPRLGAAYQITSKTVLRAGFGVVYNKTANNGFTSQFIASSNPLSSTGLFKPAMTLAGGVPLKPVWPNLDPGQQPAFAGQLGSAGAPGSMDPNAGRPARLMQWSIGLQREITRNLVVEATYVGNRGAWWRADSLKDINRLTPEILKARGLDVNNPDDRTLLTSAISSPLAVSRGFKAPYAGFSPGLTVAQSLRPFPAFGAIASRWAPLGDTWYNSLQARVTKRYSYGLDFTYSFVWQKELTLGVETEDNNGFNVTSSVNDVVNRSVNRYISGLSQPLQSVFAANYTLPKLETNKVLSWAVRDWTIGAILQYKSGLPIRAPYAQNQLGSLLMLAGGANSSFMNRVPGRPLFTQDLNCHCFNPATNFVLNKDAWSNPAPGQFGTSAAYYNDYRYQRRPSESMSLGRIFRLGDRAQLHIRAEFTNVLNRTEASNPTATNALATQTRNSAGQTTGGFGYINVGTVASAPRAGTIVARITF